MTADPTREDLNYLPARRLDGDPADEAEHFYRCRRCGEAADMRQLGDVLHHEGRGHKPLGRPS